MSKGIWTVEIPGGPALVDNVMAAIDAVIAGRTAGPQTEALHRLRAGLESATWQAPYDPENSVPCHVRSKTETPGPTS